MILLLDFYTITILNLFYHLTGTDIYDFARARTIFAKAVNIP